MFAVQSCGNEECQRPLYIQIQEGEQTVYCYKCGSATLFSYQPPKQGDGDDSIPLDE